MSTAADVIRELESLADPQAAVQLQRFFKTGKGEYAEGDRFLGIKVPVTRRVVRQYTDLPDAEIRKLLSSAWHEARLAALLIMVRACRAADSARRERLFRLYLANTACINNWDLVDLSAESIVGGTLGPGHHPLLTRLARSASVWERRIAIMATFNFIKQGYLSETTRLARVLLHDRHDLIHKAVGWMLREAAKRDQAVAEAFLAEHCREMPRTMLRYAIEKFPRALRARYMAR